MESRSARFRRISREFRTVSDVTLFARMAGWSIALRVLKRVLPLPALVSLVRGEPTEFGPGRSEVAEERITTLARWACAATRLSREGNCLERGLITYRYLSGLNPGLSLVVGARPEGSEAGPRGHAWVQLGGRVVGEAPSAVVPFTRVLSFDAQGRLTVPSEPGY